MRAVPYAWLQLSHDKLKLAAAVGGITFAVMLVFMQLGLRAALFGRSVRLHRAMDYDLIMLSPRTTFSSWGSLALQRQQTSKPHRRRFGSSYQTMCLC